MHFFKWPHPSVPFFLFMTFRDLIVERLEVRNRREGLFHDLIVASKLCCQLYISKKLNMVFN
jgi:hypothetical protein